MCYRWTRATIPFDADSRPDSARALELARRIAGYVVTGQAGFAHINTLAEVFCIEFLVPLSDARTLLI